MLKANEITSTSWIVETEDMNKIGLLIQTTKGFSFYDSNGVVNYKSKNELNKKLGQISWSERIIVESKSIKLAGYPVSVDEIFDAVEGDVPSFKKTANGVKYAAGYWGLKFSNQFVGAFCPKLTTVYENEHIGAFKSKFEMNQEISVKNKRLR